VYRCGLPGSIPITNPEELNAAMSGSDKFENKSENLKGQAKEAYGDATGNEEKKSEGKVDQTKSDLKQAGEKVKDVFK
jgi:uncharacterized protein YjbJ (UPF0337 family)